MKIGGGRIPIAFLGTAGSIEGFARDATGGGVGCAKDGTAEGRIFNNHSCSRSPVWQGGVGVVVGIGVGMGVVGGGATGGGYGCGQHQAGHDNGGSDERAVTGRDDHKEPC